MTNPAPTQPVTAYQVAWYCPKLSKKGKGSRTAKFSDRAAAEAFAVGKFIYSKPSVVREVQS